MKQQHSRRALLRLFGATPALAILPAAAMAALALPALAAAPTVDPVFAAIDLHKTAWGVFVDAVSPDDRVLAGEIPTEADYAAYEDLFEAHHQALEALFSTIPATAAGCRAAGEYFVEMDKGCMPDNSGRYFTTLLKSPLFAADGDWSAPC